MFLDHNSFKTLLKSKVKTFSCTLTKLSRPDVPGGLRTDAINGEAAEIPEAGQPFAMIAEPLSFGTWRDITTSPVTDVETIEEGKFKFTTMSGSVYELTIKDQQ